MRLSEIMSQAGLARYAEIALVLFLLAFVAIVAWTFRPGARRRMDADARLPLDDDPGEPREPREPRQPGEPRQPRNGGAS
jgi:cbb3-type cytochrome oxidase subunit 3